MKRVLGLDYGSKTVGVAVSDALGLTAQGVEIIRRERESHLRGTYRRIRELAGQYAISAIVLGYPLNMDDSIGDRARKTLRFKEELEKRLNVPVFLNDERLTTVGAEEIMRESGIRREEYPVYVDKIAAMLILEDWMNHYGKDYFYDGRRA